MLTCPDTQKEHTQSFKFCQGRQIKTALPRRNDFVREGGIEPPPGVWKTPILPLNYSRESPLYNNFFIAFAQSCTFALTFDLLVSVFRRRRSSRCAQYLTFALLSSVSSSSSLLDLRLRSVGVPRFELGLHTPKACVLPLHHTPILQIIYKPTSNVTLILAVRRSKSRKTAATSTCHSFSSSISSSIK